MNWKGIGWWGKILNELFLANVMIFLKNSHGGKNRTSGRFRRKFKIVVQRKFFFNFETFPIEFFGIKGSTGLQRFVKSLNKKGPTFCVIKFHDSTPLFSRILKFCQFFVLIFFKILFLISQKISYKLKIKLKTKNWQNCSNPKFRLRDPKALFDSSYCNEIEQILEDSLRHSSRPQAKVPT